MILPSSNTVVEPVTIAIAATLPGVSLHFARFKLTQVTVDDPAASYYRSGLLLQAAQLLADAHCNVITWNGSAGGVAGFDCDRTLCTEVERSTGIPATTSSLSLLEVFRATGVRRYGLVTLNPPAMNEIIAANFRREGFECVASIHRTGLEDNFEMARVSPDEVQRLAEQCATARPDAITVFGTNTRGAAIAHEVEARLGIPVYDTVALGLWGALRRANVDRSHVSGWGQLFTH